MVHDECPTAANWAAEAEYYASEVQYRCPCGRPLKTSRSRGLWLQPDAEGLRVQDYAEKQDVLMYCRCGRWHSAQTVLGINRYAPRRRSLTMLLRGLVCAVVDAFEEVLLTTPGHFKSYER